VISGSRKKEIFVSAIYDCPYSQINIARQVVYMRDLPISI